MRFAPLLLLALAGSCLLAGFMYLLFRWGHYYLLVVPAIMGLATGGLVLLAVKQGHCRSRVIAVGSGIVAGCVLYIGYYYIGMINDPFFRLLYGANVRFLPNYIRFRMETDVFEDTHSPSKDRDKRPGHSQAIFHWVLFSMESLFVLSLATAPGFRASRKPFCESCGQWMSRELTRFELEKGPALFEAFKNGSPQALAALFAAPVFPTLPNATLALDVCPAVKAGQWKSCPIFVSLKTMTANPKGAALDHFESSKGKLLFRALQVNLEELPALLPRFPFLEAHAGKTVAVALQELRVPAEPQRETPAAVAEINAVEPEYAGKVLTRRTALIGNAYSLGALVLLFAGIALAAWGGTVAFPDKDHPGEVAPLTKALGVAGLAAGGALFVAVAAFFFINPNYFGNRFLLNLCGKQFSRRPSLLVDPKNPEAIFVEVVPKLNWGKLTLETASDVGFLCLDRERREILFEGDCERYRIPAAALISCEVESFVQGEGTHAATKIFFVILRAHRATGFWEAPVRARTGTGKLQSSKRRKWAMQLQTAIRELQSGLLKSGQIP